MRVVLRIVFKIFFDYATAVECGGTSTGYRRAFAVPALYDPRYTSGCVVGFDAFD